MTNEEIKTLLLSEEPVEHDGIRYKCIHGVIYRKNESGDIYQLVELQDVNRNSVTLAIPKRVRAIKDIPNFTGKALGRVFDENSQSSQI